MQVGALDTAILFLIVFLAPALPALLLFHLIKPEAISAGLEGTIGGFTIKTGGAAALYIILCVLAGTTFDRVGRNTIDPVQVRFEISVEGESRIVERLLSSEASKASFLAAIGSSTTRLNVDDINPERRIIRTTPTIVDRRFIGQSVKLSIDPPIPGLYLRSSEVLLQEFTPIASKYEPSGSSLVVTLDLIHKNYINTQLDYEVRYVRLITNTGNSTVNIIDFGPDAQGRVVEYEVSAKRLSENEATQLSLNWDPGDFNDLSINSVKERFDETYSASEVAGTLIGSTRFVAPDVSTGLSISPDEEINAGQGLRVIFGPTPRIEGLQGGLKAGESVLLVSRIKGGAANPSDGLPTTVRREGTRPKLRTDRLLMLISATNPVAFSDRALDFEFQHWSGTFDEFGDPQKRTSRSDKLLFLGPVEPLSRVAVPILFSNASDL
ncbi:MAG: hypothetical protein ABJR46_16370 [Tateyamaria sp.]|uniref:hypothetical protein n=1 Tax=Tateyamaria sp. TaxID=1929288 RepID=UPI00329F398D